MSQARIVKARQQAIAKIRSLGGQFNNGDHFFENDGDGEKVSLVRRWLGDQPVNDIIVPEAAVGGGVGTFTGRTVAGAVWGFLLAIGFLALTIPVVRR